MSGHLLVTGGTRGLGAAIALALGRRGVPAILTHRWGGADEGELRARFAAAGAPIPEIVESDAGDPEDTERLIAAIAASGRRVEYFVSNAAVAARGGALSLRELSRSLRYTAWPLLDHLERMERLLGALPRVVIATSSDGPDHYYPNYDYVASSKAALEAIARVVAARAAGTPTRVFVLRARQVDTGGYREIFPPETLALVEDKFARFAVTAEEVGEAAVALASGLLDGLHGGVLSLDRGAERMDNVMALAEALA